MHLLQGLGAPIALHEGVEGGIIRGRVAEAVQSDGVGQRRKIVQLGIPIPELGRRERDVLEREQVAVWGKIRTTVFRHCNLSLTISYQCFYDTKIKDTQRPEQ